MVIPISMPKANVPLRMEMLTVRLTPIPREIPRLKLRDWQMDYAIDWPMEKPKLMLKEIQKDLR